MKRTFEVKVSVEDGKVTDLHIYEGMYSHTEFLVDGVDDPISIRECISEIGTFLAEL